MTSFVVDQTFVVPDSIPRGLDQSDQCQPLLAWLATLPNGPGPLLDYYGQPVYDEHGEPIRIKHRVVFNGPFHVSDQFRLTGRTDLFLDFSDGAFQRMVDKPGVKHVVLDHCAWVIVDGLKVTGLKPAGARYVAAREAETALRFEGSQFCRVNGFVSRQIWGDHIYFGKTNRHFRLSTDCIVTDAVCGESGRDPIASAAAIDCQVLNSDFGFGRTCVDAEPNGSAGGVWGLTVKGCTFHGKSGNFFAAVGSDPTEGVVDGVTLDGCTVVGGNLKTDVGGGLLRANMTVTNCTGDVALGRGSESTNTAAVMLFKGVQGPLVVTGNRNPVQSGRGMLIARFTDCPGPVTYEGNWPA